jgi:hypothetical protein
MAATPVRREFGGCHLCLTTSGRRERSGKFVIDVRAVPHAARRDVAIFHASAERLYERRISLSALESRLVPARRVGSESLNNFEQRDGFAPNTKLHHGRNNEEVDEPRAGAVGYIGRDRHRLRSDLVDVFMSANEPLTPKEMRAAEKAKRWLAAWGPTIAIGLLAAVGAIGFGLIIETLR